MSDLFVSQESQSKLDVPEEGARFFLRHCSPLIDPLLQRVIAAVLEHEDTHVLVRLIITAAQRSSTHAQMSVTHR
jgi:hypothetical protein